MHLTSASSGLCELSDIINQHTDPHGPAVGFTKKPLETSTLDGLSRHEDRRSGRN